MKIIEEYNDKLALVYDQATRGKLKWTAPHSLANSLLPLVKKGDAILDLGCGTGQSTKFFIKKGCKVIGVDISNEMLKFAKKHKFQKLYRYDIEDGLKGLNFKNASFDAIISSGAMEFVKNFKKIIKDASHLLKPGGYITFTYEIFLKNYKLQSKKTSALGEGLVKPVPRLVSFKVYRHTPQEIKEILDKNKLKEIRFEKFIGYFKTENKTPVYYGLTVGKKI